MINNAVNAQTISVAMNLLADQAWQLNAGLLTLAGQFQLNEFDLNLDGPGNMAFTNQLSGNNALILRSGTGNTTFSGPLFGNAATIYRQTGTGVSTFTGSALQARGEIEAGRVDLNTSTSQGFLSGLFIGGAGNPAEVRLLSSGRIFEFQKVNILEDGLLNLNGFNQRLEGLIMTGGLAQSGGGTLTLTNSGSGPRITTNASAVTSTISGKVALESYSSEFNIADGAAATDALVTANITGSNTRILKTGDGTLSVTGNNTFGTGTTGSNSAWNIQSGTVEVTSDSNLGASSNNIYLDGGRLRVDGTFTNTSNRIFEVALGGGTLGVTSGNTYTLTTTNDRLRGSGAFVKDGDGILLMNQSHPNFSGTVTVNDGTLRVTASDRNISLGGSTTSRIPEAFIKALGTTNTITVNNGGLLEVLNTSTSTPSRIFIESGVTLTVQDGGTLNMETAFSDIELYGNLALMGAGAVAQLTSEDDIKIRGTTSVNAATLNMTARDGIQLGNGSAAASFEISGGGTAHILVGGTGKSDLDFTISNNSTLSLSGSGNTLNINETVTTAAELDVRSGGTLRIDGGSIVNVLDSMDVRLNSGSIFNGGTSITKGTLNVSGDLLIQAPTITNTPNILMSSTGAQNIQSITGTTTLTGLGNVIQSGSGTTTLDSSISNLDATQIDIQHGTFLLGASNRIADSTAMTLSGGTFATGGFSETLDTLTLSASSVINMGSGSSVLRYAVSSSEIWNSGASLVVSQWSGSLSGGGTDQLYFGNNTGGVTAGQLAQITFLNPEGFDAGTYGAVILSSGEVVPIVPEVETWVAIAVLMAWIAWHAKANRPFLMWITSRRRSTT